MSWRLNNPQSYAGRTIGNGQCVAFVRDVAGVPHTSTWRKGAHVRSGGVLPIGTVIATFDANGRYGNHEDGRSHVAVLVERRDDGLLVYDQWRGQPVHQRLIRYRGAGEAQPVNDGNAYHVLITVGTTTADTAA